MDLTTRDVAFLFWATLGVAALLIWRQTREPVLSVFRLLRGVVLGVLVVYAGYIALIVFAAQQAGLWNTVLLKDTIAWVILAGLGLVWNSLDSYRAPGFYRKAIRRLVGVSIVIEFLMSLSSYSVGVELLLLPVLVLLVLLSVAASAKPELAKAGSVINAILGILVVVLIVSAVVKVIGAWASYDQAQLLRQFAAPFWLTLASLPFVYALGLFLNYDTTFRRIDRAAKDAKSRRRAKLALLLSFGLNSRALHQFAGHAPGELAVATSWSDARRIIAYHRAVATLREATDDLAVKKLARYAGVAGTDWEGQPLDQREFAETKSALNLLATFHRAQHKDGRYRADLPDSVSGLLSSKTLPEPGFVSAVKKNGRAWYAWRRTVTGWCLGIGATGAPPDQWVYEGHEPPSGFPDKDEGWRRGSFGEGDE